MTKRKKRSKKKAAKKQPKEEYFVTIEDTRALRLPILECSKGTLEAMKLFQEIKKIRMLKIEKKKELKKDMKAIASTIRQIKAQLPKVRLPEDMMPKVISKKKKKTKSAPKAPPKPKPMKLTELDKIEKGLADIESKISSLS